MINELMSLLEPSRGVRAVLCVQCACCVVLCCVMWVFCVLYVRGVLYVFVPKVGLCIFNRGSESCVLHVMGYYVCLGGLRIVFYGLNAHHLLESSRGSVLFRLEFFFTGGGEFRNMCPIS